MNMKKKLPLDFISLQGKHAGDDRGSPGSFTRIVQKKYCQLISPIRRKAIICSTEH